MPRFLLPAIAALLLAHPAAAAARPDSSGFFGLNGVGFFHYRDAPDAAKTAEMRMAALKKAGATWDRFDFWWGVVEPEKGKWSWDKADWIVDFYARNHVQMLPILCYGAAWMKESPRTPQDYADYGAFVRRVVGRYKGRVRAWEIWNEPNIPTFWKPQPDVAAYTELLKAGCTAAHQADPRCVVVGASANETDINWLRDIAARGGLRYMDAVSIHPYSMSDGPDQMDLARQLRNVRMLLRANGRPDMPLWITEMGWISSIDEPAGMDAASRYMLESHAVALAQGVERLTWFNLQDWREGNHLEGWGLLSPEGREKRTMNAYRQMTRRLAGARFAGYAPVDGPGCAYAFRRGSRLTLVAWAPRRQTATLTFRGPVQASSVYGASVFANNGLLTLTDDPIYVECSEKALARGLQQARPAEPDANLIVNARFAEVDPGGSPYGWHRGMFYGGADKGAFGTARDEEGRIVLSLSKTEDAFWQSFPVPAMPGERYILTAQVRTTDATGENGVQILYLSGPGWGWRGGPVTKTITGTTKGWQTVTVEGVVPEDADVVRVNLVSKGNKGSVHFRAPKLIRSGNM